MTADLYTKESHRLVTVHACEADARACAKACTLDGCPTRAYRRTVKIYAGMTVVIWMTAPARGAQ